jgi:hypothetical protein
VVMVSSWYWNRAVTAASSYVESMDSIHGRRPGLHCRGFKGSLTLPNCGWFIPNGSCLFEDLGCWKGGEG